MTWDDLQDMNLNYLLRVRQAARDALQETPSRPYLERVKLRRRIHACNSTLADRHRWLCPDEWTLIDWLESGLPQHLGIPV